MEIVFLTIFLILIHSLICIIEDDPILILLGPTDLSFYQKKKKKKKSRNNNFAISITLFIGLCWQ